MKICLFLKNKFDAGYVESSRRSLAAPTAHGRPGSAIRQIKMDRKNRPERIAIIPGS